MNSPRYTEIPALFVKRLVRSCQALQIASCTAAILMLAGCASATAVTATDSSNTYEVSASAAGGSLAWARAHDKAVSEARSYCARRGLQASFKLESIDGVEALQHHESQVRFECHPSF